MVQSIRHWLELFDFAWLADQTVKRNKNVFFYLLFIKYIKTKSSQFGDVVKSINLQYTL